MHSPTRGIGWYMIIPGQTHTVRVTLTYADSGRVVSGNLWTVHGNYQLLRHARNTLTRG